VPFERLTKNEVVCLMLAVDVLSKILEINIIELFKFAKVVILSDT